MKFTTATGLLALASIANAYPAAGIEEAFNEDPAEFTKRAEEILEAHKRQDTSSADDAAKTFEPFPIFNAKKQLIDVGPGSGHQFVAPGPNDQRGPCPGKHTEYQL